MRILSTTMCYPTPANPTQGVFVARRLCEIAKLVPLNVVAPIPWFPMVRPMAAGAAAVDSPPVQYIRMAYIPLVLKRFDPWCYGRALGSACREQDFDLIDAHFEWPDGVGAFRVARRSKKKFVCTLRGKLVSQLQYRSRRRAIVEMLRGADALISVSRSLADLAHRAAGCELNIRVIPNGVDTSVFQYRPESRTASGARHVVSVGHLQELKGFHHLLEMWPLVRKRAGDIRLTLVGGCAGEPKYERMLRQRVAALRLESLVSFVGRLPPERVAEMLNRADLFILASRSEGWCNAIAESLACGCPVVATDVGGNAEVMNEWGLGRLVPYGNWEGFADRICTSLEEDWDRAVIAKFGGRRSWQQVARECVDVFDEVIGK